MKSIKKFLYEKQVEIIMCILTAFFAVLIATMCGCTTTKRIVKTDATYKSKSSQVDSTAQITNEKIDLLLSRLTETKDRLSEWAAERIDYNVVDYDTLGRIIRSATQTTDRQSGRHKDKHIVDNTTTTLTILHIDSLIRLSEARIMSQIEEKNAIAVSIGLAWWQKVLMYLGVASVIAGLFFVARRIIKRFL